MKIQKHQFVVVALSVCVLLGSIFLPAVSQAQSTTDDLSLLQAIQASILNLSAEIRGLRGEVKSLRVEVRSGGGTVSPLPIAPTPLPAFPPLPTPASTPDAHLYPVYGDSGEDVLYLQELLIYLGSTIPAGATGTFLGQTQSAIEELQREYGLPETGTLNAETRSLLIRLSDFTNVYTPLHEIDSIDAEEVTAAPATEVAPVSVGGIVPLIRISVPRHRALIDAGAETVIVWDTSYAPSGAEIEFHLINKLSGADKFIFKTDDLAGTYSWTPPDNMPSDNSLVAKLLYSPPGSRVTEQLASKSITVSIIGTSQSTTNTTNLGTSNSVYVDFYTGTAFTSCMSEYPETVALINGWLYGELLRHEFPWNEITGAAADKIVVCEGDEFPEDENYGNNYVNCLDNSTAATCSAVSSCEWFDTFCGQEGYDPGSGSGIDDGSGSGSGQIYSCFYSDATINGEVPGYTVWCEYDYQNCREGDKTGATVSLDGLVLGEPNNCESGSSTTQAYKSSLVANALGAIANAFSSVFRSIFDIR